MMTESEDFAPSDWSVKDSMGRRALHYLVQSDLTGEMLQWLVDKKDNGFELDLNVMTDGGVTPLMLAVKLNREKVIEVMVNASANPFLKDQLG